MAESNESFEVAHRCKGCMRLFRPEQMNEDANFTGAYVCPVCSHAGPLNVEIVPTEEIQNNP